MIHRLHNRFIWNSFLLVCIILQVIFLLAGAGLLRYADHSIKNTLDKLLAQTAQAEQAPGGFGFYDWSGAGQSVGRTVGGTRFPSYLFELKQATVDLQTTTLAPEDRLICLDGDYSEEEEGESWRALINRVLQSKRTIASIQEENLCFRVDRTGSMIRIAVIDYSAYLQLFKRLLVVESVVFLSLAGAFLILIWLFAKKILQPAERAWERQERFVGDASHEIKTPLAIILSTAELPATDDRAETDRRFIVIRDESRRINLLISRMLESARIEDKAAQHRSDTVFSLSDAATECALRYEALLYENGIELITDVEDGIYVFADESALKQALCTLLDNATKYTPRGNSATVSARKRRYRTAEITVRNEGIGIPASERTVIFDRFYRADEGRAHEEGSYGLGLAIAKNLIESMGGRIRCDSDGQTYTAFIVNMRLVRVPKTKK